MELSFEEKCRALLAELGIANSDNEIVTKPLTGGVASDIAQISVGEEKFCVKFALPKLKVEADWFAPVHRNRAEYAWLEVASKVAPQNAVKLYGRSEEHHGFVMEFLEGSEVYLWKTELLAGAADKSEARKVGELLGQIHSTSSKVNFDGKVFQNRDDFYDLRIEPYLVHTASKYPDIASELKEIAEHLFEANHVLVHGDVSPKNILFRDGQPIILDAECATMGDASFDPSFCLNHLILKAIHIPSKRKQYLTNVVDFWDAYTPYINWETAHSLETRICKLVPALMLARIDGKSPVEYLTDGQRETVRYLAIKLINTPSVKLSNLTEGIREILKEIET